MLMQCPICKDTPRDIPDGKAACGTCLMTRVEIVDLVPVEVRDIGHAGRVAIFPVRKP